MTARRQPSTTSLSKYARAHSTEFTNRSLDFCNAFWGPGDVGVDVLFARMRGALRTMEELRNYWKERAMIEEQYAKRLSSLSKFHLGRDEIGELRNSLDTLRLETDKQATFHLQVAQQIKTDLEGQTNVFLNKQLHHKKTFQSAIEKEFKTKQTQEGYVNKAKEKYEGDCVRINSYTAQSTLMQGKDLERIQLKLERAQQTVHANERDFANFARALQDTVQKWELDWKTFCDSSQDLEEERLDFMKDSMWAYANAVSTVCVADDESCEKMRLALEQLEPDKDMENFVRDYGTGNAIPDPPAFVNYANPDAPPPSSQRPSSHTAQFMRASQRAARQTNMPPPPQPQPEEDPLTMVNTAGVGAGGGRRGDHGADSQNGRGRSRSRSDARQAPPSDYSNGSMVLANGSLASSQNLPGGGSSPMAMRPADPQAEPIDPRHKTMLKVGEHAYEVDLTRDPQARASQIQNGAVGPSQVGKEDDPLAQQMEQLRNAASSGGSIRRHQQPAQPQMNGSISPAKNSSSTQLSLPPGSRGGGPPNRDYRRSAEIVVGAFPPNVPPSRPTSPNAPTASFMVPPSSQPTNDVQAVLADYQQSLPGERKSISRPGSRASFNGPPPQHPQQQQNRPLSMEGGQAGIGAQGRSPSPQPFRPPSRGPSPAMQQPPPQHPASPANRRNSYRVPPQANNSPPANGANQASPIRQNTIAVPQIPVHQQRPTSPNGIGIALAPDGRVAVDTLAQQYQDQMQNAPQHNQYRQPPPMQQQPIQQQQPPSQQIHQRSPSYGMPPPSQPPYGAPPPAPSGYPPSYPQQPQPPQAQQPPAPIQQQPSYAAPRPGPPQTQYQPQAQIYQQHQQPQQHADYSHQNGGMVQRVPSMNNGGYYGNGQMVPQQQQQQQQQQPMPYQQQQQARAPSPMRAPSPQPPRQNQAPPPTGAWTSDGRGILFYVKALYDYQAVIEEEFDFQAGDIIAVTDTPEDGWWSGELLDEARREPGRHVFPSNFVCLF